MNLSTSTSIELGEILKPFSLQCQFDYAEKRHCDRCGETKLQRGHQDEECVPVVDILISLSLQREEARHAEFGSILRPTCYVCSPGIRLTGAY